MNSLDNLLLEIPQIMEKESVIGLSVAAIQNGAIYTSQGYGYRDKKKKLKMTGHTILQAASLSKSLTAWGILHICEKERIGLDSPINNYLKRWKFPPSEYPIEGITIRRILYHMAGLSVMSYYGSRKKSISSLEDSLYGTYDKRYQVKIMLKPGENFSYSGGGFTLLQLFIEEVSGRNFAEYMTENILHPLGMYDSYFNPVKIDDPIRVAKPYSAYERELPYYYFTEAAAAGLYTTAYDLGKFICAHMSNCGILQDDFQGLICQRLDRRVRSGCGNYVLNECGKKIVLQRGQNRGWVSSFDMIPSKRCGFVILTNSYNGQNAIITLLEKWYELQLGKEAVNASHYLLSRHKKYKLAMCEILVQMGIFRYKYDVFNLSTGKNNG